MSEYLVVGSGPAGVSAASALLDCGRTVTLVDVGLGLESARQELVERVAQQTPDQWDRRDLAPFYEGANADAKGLSLKRLFGSDFPYRSASEKLGLEIPTGTLKPSFALGGLSNTWGAVVMPYNDTDLAGWPIREAELAPHYRSVCKFMPIIASVDDLSANHPIYHESPQPSLPGRQVSHILTHMSKRREALSRAGISFGHARVAMRSRDCQKCGLCLHGCPYDLIYNSRQTIELLKQNPRFTYLPSQVVRAVSNQDDQVLVRVEDFQTGQMRDLKAARCFLGAGVLGTARIVLESLKRFDRPVRMIDSQHNVLPLLMFRNPKGVREERSHSLCQMFLEVNDSSLSRHGIHLQLYGYSDMFNEAFSKLAGGLAAKVPGLRGQFLGRLLVALCYLHSDESGHLTLRLESDGEGRPGRMVAETVPSSSAAAIVKRLSWKLFRHSSSLGLMAAAPAVHITPPGRGFHTGGSFPMSETPGEFQVDTLGQLTALPRVHLVDASDFPTIPATTITYTVMANAHRIATLASQIDSHSK